MSNLALAQMAIANLSAKERQELARTLVNDAFPGVHKEKHLTTRKAAAILECHDKTVLRYGKLGLLTPIKRNHRHLRWKQSEVERLASCGGAR